MTDFDFSSGEPERCPDTEQQRRTSCTSPTKLDKSRMSMQQPAQETSNDMLFKPPCGFKLEGRDSYPPAHLRLRQKVKVTIADRISAIDVQMAHLQRQKNMLMDKRLDMDMADEHLELQATRDREGKTLPATREGGVAPSQ